MACGGCGANRMTTAQRLAAQAAARVPANQRVAPAAPTTNQAAKAPTTGQTQQFALDLNTGQTLTFGSKLEAEAENVRRGYTGKVKPL